MKNLKLNVKKYNCLHSVIARVCFVSCIVLFSVSAYAVDVKFTTNEGASLLQSYDDQDITPEEYDVLEGGRMLSLKGNNWKALPFSYDVTENTVLEFDFRSYGGQAEVNSIGFDDNRQASHAKLFQLYGERTMDTSIEDYRNHKGHDWVSYRIPVGAHYTGSMSYLVFLHDNDKNVDVYGSFRNVKVYEHAFPSEEVDARDTYFNNKIDLSGVLLDKAGTPVSGASIRLLGSEVATTDADGHFNLENEARVNNLLEIKKSGYRDEILPVHMAQPVSLETLTLQPIYLSDDDPDVARFQFGGDTAFSRRMMNPRATNGVSDPNRYHINDSDHPDAFIKPSNPLPGMEQVLSFVSPLFNVADITSLNFESTVHDNPSTSHLTTGIAFFSLSPSPQALENLGVDYVALANNHNYDYLDDGASATLKYFEESKLGHSGLGMDLTEALEPEVLSVRNAEYSMLSMSYLHGKSTPLLVATDSKPGPADLRDTERVNKAIMAEVDKGRVPVVQLHHGFEYYKIPSRRTRNRMKNVANAGAKLVISHHPHVPQGYGWENDAFIAHSLGNFAFDQFRPETMLSTLTQVEVDGNGVIAASAYPIYSTDYRPRILLGETADNLSSFLGGISDAPLTVYPYNGITQIALQDSEREVVSRTVDISISIPSNGSMTLDFANLEDLNFRSDESLAKISINRDGLTGRLGRDILHHGTMEDFTVDGLITDNPARWVLDTRAYRGVSNPKRGAAALYSQGSAGAKEVHKIQVFYSSTKDNVYLPDRATISNDSEVSVAEGVERVDIPGEVITMTDFSDYATLHTGFAICEGAPEIAFGSDRFFQTLGATETGIDIDAVHIHSDGKVSFSTIKDFTTDSLGLVKDGSVVTYDSSLSSNDPNMLTLLLDEDEAFSDDEDIDAIYIESNNLVQFSTALSATVGINSLDIKDGDIVRYNVSTKEAEIVHTENDIFVDDGNLGGISYFNERLFFTTREDGRRINGGIYGDITVNEDVIVMWDPSTGQARPYGSRPQFYSSKGLGKKALNTLDINALHVQAALGLSCEPIDIARPQIQLRERVKVEGYAEGRPNKDLSVLGYIRLENNGPVKLLARYYNRSGSFGPERYGQEVVFEENNSQSNDWEQFISDLSMPANVKAVSVELHHETSENQFDQLVGLDDIRLINWKVDSANEPVEFDLTSADTSFPTPHAQKFLRLEGRKGSYTLTLTFERYIPKL